MEINMTACTASKAQVNPASRNPNPYVVVTNPGQDNQDIWGDYPNYKQAIAALNEADEPSDIMKRLDDGTLTTEF